MTKKNKIAPVQDKGDTSSEMMRRFKSNPALFLGTFAVLVLIVVSFVLVPAIVPEGTRGGGDFVFGYYDRAPIAWVPGNYFSQYQEQLARMYRNVDLNDFQVGINIWMQAFEAAAIHVAILQEMSRSNYEIPISTVDRQVAQLPQFQDNGRFSAALYRQMSDSSRLVLWRQVRDELTKIMFFNDAFSLLLPSGEVDFLANMASDLRTFDMVAFNVDDFPTSEYLRFAEQNSDLFRTIHLSRITAGSSEREARRILDSVRNGTITFEDVARSQSQDGFADRGGDMGLRYVFEIEREILSAADRERVLRLGVGEISDVIRIGDRWAFFRVEDELKNSNFEDAVVMDRVRSYLRNFARGRMEDWAVDQANSFIAEAETSGFDTAARWFNREVHRFGPLPVNFGNVDLFTMLDSFSIPEFSRQELSGLSQNIDFWLAAFSASLNSPSRPMVHGNRVLVFLPAEYIAADEEDIEQIKSVISSYWINFILEQSLQPYFMNNPKMDNRFWDTYSRIFMPGF
jgi:hypothetical protein